MLSQDIARDAKRLAHEELRFLDELDVDLGQRRSKLVLALYLHGLRTCDERRTLARIAASVCGGDEVQARVLVERFNYQLNDRRARTGESWASRLMDAIARRVSQRLRPQALMLVAMYAPRLGSRLIRNRDISEGSAQMVAALLAVGRGPSNDLEAVPISWRLSFEGWSPAQFERAHVPSTLHRNDHIAVPATTMLANIGISIRRDLPIVASGPFAELRLGWLAAGQSYVVDWKKPTPAASTAIDQHPVPPADTIHEEIQYRLEHPWRDVRTSRVQTSIGLCTRIDVLSKFGRAETDLELDADRVWCAHLRGVPPAEMTDRIIDYAELRDAVRPIYQDELRRLGLDDYRGSSFAGWHAHRALVSAAHLLNRELEWPVHKGY